MKLEKYDRNMLLVIIISTFINFLAHVYDYVFYKGNFVVNGFSAYYDVPEHLLYTMELLRSEHPFPNPMAAGFTINYPIGLPLLIAIVVTITGASLLQAFRVFSLILNIFIGLTSYIMVSSLLKNKRIGCYATFFILFSGGFFWTTYLFPILSLSRSGFLYEFLRVEYSYYTSLISVNLFRPLSRTFGFGLFCFYFYFLNMFLKSKKIKYMLLNGFLLGILLNTSPGMIIELFILSIMTLLYFKPPLNNTLKYFLTLLVSIFLFSIPLSLELVTGALTGKTILGVGRYLSPLFYMPFFGIAFVFMIIGVLFYPMKETKIRDFLLLWLAIALFLANIPLIGTTYQAAIIALLLANTHVFTLLLNIPVYIFSSLGLVKILDLKPIGWPIRWFNFKRYGILLLVITCCFSTFLVIYIRGYKIRAGSMATEEEYNALMWVRKNTKKDDLFLTFHYINMEKTEIRGKLVRAGRGHSWVTIIGERRVLLNLKAVFLSRGINRSELVVIASDIDFIYTSTNAQKTIQLLESYFVTYIYVGPDEQERYEVAMNKFGNQKYFDNVYLNDLVTIYKLKTT